MVYIVARTQADNARGEPSIGMALVELPRGIVKSLNNGFVEPGNYVSAHSTAVQDYFHHVDAIEVPVKNIQGRLYVRISAHIYNCMEDYVSLGEAVRRLQQRPLEV